MFAKVRLSAGLLVLAVSTAMAQQPSPAMPGVLLLRNGQVIEGQIRQLPDYFEVSQPDQELRVRAADVDCCCRSLEEGYQRKRLLLQADNVQEHLALAEWCERNHLLNRVIDELNVSVAIDPRHPMIDVLRRRLTVAAEKPRPTVRPSAAATPGEQAPSAEDLETMIRSMPPGTVESFVQVIQPMLLNTFPAGLEAGRTASGRLQLVHAASGAVPSRRVTQRNLYAVLKFIDYDNPGDSPLLRMAAGRQMGAITASLDHQTAQNRRLIEWVYRVAMKPLPETPQDNFAIPERPVSTGFDNLVKPIPTAPKHDGEPLPPRIRLRTPDVIRASAEEPIDTPATDARSRFAPAPGRGAPHVKRGGTAPTPKSPAKDDVTDPFDPTVFNRQGPSLDATQQPMSTPAAKAMRGAGQ